MGPAPYPDFFNDVFGPVMQPGSSSHTAGPCRLGCLAADLLGETPMSARVLLDAHGSFAGTFGLMAEDRAMLAGILGLLPDDERLFHSFRLAAARGLEYGFEFGDLVESNHPNAVKFVLTGAGGRVAELVGASLGGGAVETAVVDGFALRLRGESHALLVFDPAERLDEGALRRLRRVLPPPVDEHRVGAPGRGVLHVVLLGEQPDLAAVRDALGGDGGVRGDCGGEPDVSADVDRSRAVRDGVRLALLRPVVPVVTPADRGAQLFGTMTRWRELAEECGEPLWEVAVRYEMAASRWSRRRVVEHMGGLARLMRRQTTAAYDEGAVVPSSPFKPEFTARWAAHEASHRRVSDDLMAATIRAAYGAGAGIPGVLAVPGPMGGGGGYVYAALAAVRDDRGLDEEALVRGLFVAAGVGAIAYTRSSPTGEVIGCTGEAGVCGAMAAAAIAEMVGGAPQQVEDAASLALQGFTGMPCDPMPGGLCQPCRSRVLAATCMAHVFADLALAGHEAALPFHEALDVADGVGRALPPELLCTSEGGACTAPAARRRREEFARWIEETAPEDRPPGNLI
jgi:L-serine dehydratase